MTFPGENAHFIDSVDRLRKRIVGMETVMSDELDQITIQLTQLVVDTIIDTPNSRDDESDTGDDNDEEGDQLLEPFRHRQLRRASLVIPTFENSEEFLEGLGRNGEDPKNHQREAMRVGDLIEPFKSRGRCPYAMKSIWRSLPSVSLPNVSWSRVSWPSGPPTQEMLMPESNDRTRCQQDKCETQMFKLNDKIEFDKFKEDMRSANMLTVNGAHQTMQNILVNKCNANCSRGHTPVQRHGDWQSNALGQNTKRENVLEVTNISSNAFARDDSAIPSSSRMNLSSTPVSKSLRTNLLGSSSSLLQSCKGRFLSSSV